MKTKQTKIDRSAAKWLPGAMALAATTASSQAAVVQITLTGNKISTTGNQLVADLTGDRVDDVVIGTVAVPGGVVASVRLGAGNYASVVARRFSALGPISYIVDAGIGSGGARGFVLQSRSLLNPITFTDWRINGGAQTYGWLQVNAFNTSATDHTVELARLIFDNASTTAPTGLTSASTGITEWQISAVPEPGSNLALLALGAGGLTLRRRLKRAA